MASLGFVWDAIKRRLKDSAAGRFVARRTLVRLRDDAATAAGARMRDLAERAATGAITAEALRVGMRTAIRDANGAAYLLGRGGVNAMTPGDFRTLAGLLRTQHAYLDGFVAAIERGELTAAQAMARAELYAGASVKAHEVGMASAWGVDRSLPEYPGERCAGGPNCRCSWDVQETATAIEATWRLGADDACGPCRDNAARYNPLVLPKPFAPPSPEPVRLTAVRRLA